MWKLETGSARGSSILKDYLWVNNEAVHLAVIYLESLSHYYIKTVKILDNTEYFVLV